MFQEYLKKIEPRIKALDKEIEKVRAKAEKTTAGFKEAYQDQVERILVARKRVRSELANLGEAGSERFEDVRKDVERAIDDLRKRIDEIVVKIRKAA